MAIGVDELREALDQRDAFAAENARLQRVVNDLADALRWANAEVWALAHGYGFPGGDTQVSSSGVRKRVIEIGRKVSASLLKHGLLRPADRPECVPESMRAGAEE